MMLEGRHRGLLTQGAPAAAAAVLPVLIAPSVFSGHPFLLLFQFGLVVPLTWRRWSPLVIFASVYALVFVQYLTTPLNVPSDGALFVALYLVAVHRELRTVWAVGSLTSVLVLLDGLRLVPHHASGWSVVEAAIGMAGLVIAAAAIGASVRSRRAYLDAVADRAARSERERIARELHDVVTHSLSVMVTLADGAQAASLSAPDQAAEAMAMVAGTGRQALVDMRRFLDLLREDEPDAARHPQPGIAQLTELVSTVRAAGLPVRLALEGDPAGLPTAVQLTVYRVVQESLTNALKHATGSDARVLVSRSTNHVDVEVCDAGGTRPTAVPPSAGQGIAGMRQRVAAYGGLFDAGPRTDGGWLVRATLPLADGEAGA